MPDIYIRPKEIPSSTTTMSPALIGLAVQLGEFKATSGIEFDTVLFDRMHLKVTYHLDEAFIALRLKFGHLFVEKPQAAPQRPAPPPPLNIPASRPKVRPLTAGGESEVWTWQDRLHGKTARQRLEDAEREEAARQIRDLMNRPDSTKGWTYKLSRGLFGK